MFWNRKPQPERSADGATRLPSFARTIGVKILNRDAHPTLELSGPLVLGSQDSCDLPLDAPGVAPRHAEIYRLGDLWWVRDLGTDEGIFVDDEAIDVAPVAGPTIMRLGTAGPTLRLTPRSS